MDGFLKADGGILKLIGNIDNVVGNEIQLRTTIYNLAGLINLKDIAYWMKNTLNNSIIHHKDRLYAVSKTTSF